MGLLVVKPRSLQLCTLPHPYSRVHTCIPFWMKTQAGCPDILYVRVSQGHMVLMNRVPSFPVHLVSLSIPLYLGSSLPCPVCLVSPYILPAWYLLASCLLLAASPLSLVFTLPCLPA